MWGMIATWAMALEGVEKGADILKENGDTKDAVEKAICCVEDDVRYTSVGYGGLPNEQMQVELDSAFMDGDTLDIGAVAGLHDYANPIKIARSLAKEHFNNFLVGSGADAYAHKHGFQRKNMLSEKAKQMYEKRKKETLDKGLSAYSGHDTVVMLGLDQKGSMCAGASTSGLFMKKAGRVGDSPLSGSGYYADSQIGCAGATGLGEDIMKTCGSYEIVRLMKEGMHPQQACEKVVEETESKLLKRKGEVNEISYIAMDKDGNWGAATNAPEFPVVIANEKEEASIYLVSRKEDHTMHVVKADAAWLKKNEESLA